MLSFKQFYLIEADIEELRQKYYSDIDSKIFNDIVKSDPESEQFGSKKMGPYSKWALQLFKNKKLKAEDIYKLKDAFSTYKKLLPKLKQEEKNLYSYKDLGSLFSVLDKYEVTKSKSEEVKDIKQSEAELIEETDKWKVIVPKTEKASCIYGSGTRWCTAAENNNMFDYYTKKEYPNSKLFIIINKQDPKEKYQFHVESNSYMDTSDNNIYDSLKEEILNDLPKLKKITEDIYENIKKQISKSIIETLKHSKYDISNIKLKNEILSFEVPVDNIPNMFIGPLSKNDKDIVEKFFSEEGIDYYSEFNLDDYLDGWDEESQIKWLLDELDRDNIKKLQQKFKFNTTNIREILEDDELTSKISDLSRDIYLQCIQDVWHYKLKDTIIDSFIEMDYTGRMRVHISKDYDKPAVVDINMDFIINMIIDVGTAPLIIQNGFDFDDMMEFIEPNIEILSRLEDYKPAVDISNEMVNETFEDLF